MPEDAVRIEIEGWDQHQHYSKRNPPWIKLHSKLLDNAEWGVLSGDAAKLLVMLWLMAAKDGTEGVIETTVSKLSWRTHHDSTALADLLNSLRDNDFLTYASTALASRKHESSASSIEGRDTENREQPENIEAEDKSSEAGASDSDEPAEVDLLDFNPEDNADWKQLKLHYYGPLRKLIWQGDNPPPNTPNPGKWDEANELSIVRHWLRSKTLYADEVEPFFRQLRTHYRWIGPASLAWVNTNDHAATVREVVNETRKRMPPKAGLAVSIGGRRVS